MTREKPKYRGKLVESYRTVCDVLPGLSKSAQIHYPTYIGRFCEFVGKTPDAIIEERHKHLRFQDERVRRTYEGIVMKFHEHVKEKLKIRETSAYQHFVVIQGWFARNYGKLEYAKRGPRRPKDEARDYIPTIGEVRDIVEVSKVRDKAIFLTMLQSGLAPADMVCLKRGWFDRVVQAGEYPSFIADISREKTRASARVFIGRDAGRAIKRYLDLRTDDNPCLFVDLRRRVLTKDEGGNPLKTEVRPLKPDYIDKAFQKSVDKSGVAVPNGLRLRVYSLRKIHETKSGKVMNQAWVDLQMGHTIAGARAAYIKPTVDEHLEAYRKAEPLLSITEAAPALRGDEVEAMVSEIVDRRFSEYAAKLVVKQTSGDARVASFFGALSAMVKSGEAKGKGKIKAEDLLRILVEAGRKSGMGE